MPYIWRRRRLCTHTFPEVNGVRLVGLINVHDFETTSLYRLKVVQQLKLLQVHTSAGRAPRDKGEQGRSDACQLPRGLPQGNNMGRDKVCTPPKIPPKADYVMVFTLTNVGLSLLLITSVLPTSFHPDVP